MPDSTVADIMTTDVITVNPDASLADAAGVLTRYGHGAAPVTDESGALVGLLRDDDLLVSEARLHLPTTIAVLPGVEFTLPASISRYDRELRKALGSVVSDVMANEFPTVAPGDTVEYVATVMYESGETHVPVVEGGRLVGIVARADLVRLLAASS